MTDLRVVSVVIRPRDRKQLALAHDKVAEHVKKAFGGICVSVSGIATTNDAWKAACVIDARKAPEAALLFKHPQDERLWRTFIESSYTSGSCDVVEMEPIATAPARTVR